jgi:exodeoxyribonuclease VII small subunit
MEESKRYQDMLQEVEAIVRQISSPDLDLDGMVSKVERGYLLIEKMKERLNTTKSKLDELHKRFDEI